MFGCAREHVVNEYYLSMRSPTRAAATQLGFIKIEMQNGLGVWSDITTEILNLGIAQTSQWPIGAACADPTPNAVIRLQRLRDSADGTATTRYRAAPSRPTTGPTCAMRRARGQPPRRQRALAAETLRWRSRYAVTLDVNNLRSVGRCGRSSQCGLAVNGNNAQNNNGFIVSKALRIAPQQWNAGVVNPAVETGEYGFEDVINPADVNGAPNGVLDAGEDD